jgi:hypothetical protein
VDAGSNQIIHDCSGGWLWARRSISEVTLYALRHSSIVRDLLANVPVRIVATKHDTSIPMIESNYSKYIADHADVLSRRALLDPSTPSGDNVISLR